jgi:murein DD-endopeptidase MepM/ murein hydrolase activator NlpD
VNEGHLSGHSPDYDAYGYDPYSTGSYPTVGTAFADDATGTYAAIPQQYAPVHDQDQGYGSGYGTGYGYDPNASQSWDTGGYATYDPYGYGPGGQAAEPTATGTAYYETGTFTAVPQPQPLHQPQQDWDSGAYPAYGYGYGYGYDASGDTGLYEQLVPDQPAPHQAHAAAAPGYPTSYGTGDPYAGPGGTYAGGAHTGGPHANGPYPEAPFAEDQYAADPYAGHPYAADPYAEHPIADDPYAAGPSADTGYTDADDVLTAAAARDEQAPRHDFASDGYTADGLVDGEPAARSRRRKPAKRSALLTIAVPSVAVMGVAAVGAAAVAGVGMAQNPSKTRADDALSKAPTQQLDRQLTGASRDADDFATRANRSQERVDLKERQAAAKKAAAEAAARKEALRPKFVLPVTQKGLSAYFGQAGVNWMALHTGIDFPVQVGTPVMAATDGTVRTQWNPSYGNMAIVTAPDGTETWYCHLSSTKIRSGSVKAGTVIAYSGNTGNTTGPHLHFEVRPHGGSPIDPLPWLLAHGLDPR